VPNTAIKIFYSYARKDRELRDTLDKHLAPLLEAGRVETWHDLQLEPGIEWEPDLLAQMKAADIILLLISVDFLASQYCYSTELQVAIDRHNAGQAKVIPVILRPCDWNHDFVPFSKLNVLPPGAKPVTSWPDPDEAYAIVAQEIRKVLHYLQPDNLPPKTPVYFTSIELTSILCFKTPQTLDLRSPQGTPAQWTVILGDNGVGKTTLLRSLAALEPTTSSTYTSKLSQDRSSIFAQSLHTSAAKITAHLTCGTITDSPTKTITLSLQAPNELNGKITGNGRSALPNLQCYGYGASRHMGSTSLSETLSPDRSLTLFTDTETLINAEEWLLQADYAARTDNTLQSRFNLIKDTLQNLLPDITDIRITPATKAKPQPTAEFETPYGWVSIASLGLGYRTTIAWIVDLAARMIDRYPDSPTPLAEPAIVLVDEIDLHLHPQWQRTIMNFLSQRFPQTQFIVTAHSPLVVQAAQHANLVLLRRDNDTVVIDNNPEIIENWRVDQVLTSVFGLPSAHAVDIEPLLQRRRQLLAKSTLTKKDRAELQELETQIGRIPTAESPADIQAMDIIRKAAQILENQ
jgi:predicted ATP-binding protein involved in virulence